MLTLEARVPVCNKRIRLLKSPYVKEEDYACRNGVHCPCPQFDPYYPRYEEPITKGHIAFELQRSKQ